MCLKKQQRKEYPQKNVIYVITTEDNKKNRIYIIGKAKELKTRLSTYNKTAEHEVVYYKESKSEDHLNIVEGMVRWIIPKELSNLTGKFPTSLVLAKLDNYKEKANRDRFILPLEKDIIFFTDIIDSAINSF